MIQSLTPYCFIEPVRSVVAASVEQWQVMACFLLWYRAAQVNAISMIDQESSGILGNLSIFIHLPVWFFLSKGSGSRILKFSAPAQRNFTEAHGRCPGAPVSLEGVHGTRGQAFFDTLPRLLQPSPERRDPGRSAAAPWADPWAQAETLHVGQSVEAFFPNVYLIKKNWMMTYDWPVDDDDTQLAFTKKPIDDKVIIRKMDTNGPSWVWISSPKKNYITWYKYECVININRNYPTLVH